MTDNKYNFIEVCAGCGGLSSGLMKAGLIPKLLNDINKDCCETLKLNHVDSKVKCCSMEKLNISKYKNKIDLLAGGIPCQSFSLSGMRKGFDDERGTLIYTFIEMINKLEPKIIMIENVKGLLSHNNGETIKEFITRLNESNLYNIQYRLINSVNYKVPQKRERVIIIGVLKKYDVKFKFPKKSDTIINLESVLTNVPDSG